MKHIMTEPCQAPGLAERLPEAADHYQLRELPVLQRDALWGHFLWAALCFWSLLLGFAGVEQVLPLDLPAPTLR